MKMQYQRYRKLQFCIQLYISIWEIVLIYKLINIGLEPRILIASFLLTPLLNTNGNVFFSFISLVFFNKEKKRACCKFMFFSTELFLKSKTLKAKQTRYLKNVFMVILIRLKYFLDSLNIVLILALGREFFWAKCVQFLLTFTEWN